MPPSTVCARRAAAFRGVAPTVTTDIVVVRDDRKATGANPFQNLTDPKRRPRGTFGRPRRENPFPPDRRPGQRSAAPGGDPVPGRRSPRRHERYRLPGLGRSGAQFDFVLHIRRSTDRGITWSPADLLTVPNGTNAALAINILGTIGLLYQQLTGTCSPDAAG